MNESIIISSNLSESLNVSGKTTNSDCNDLEFDFEMCHGCYSYCWLR
jgi:hypothetical protein